MAFTAAPLPSLGLVIDTGKSDPGLFFINRSDSPALTSTQLRVGRRAVGEHGAFALNGQDATLDKATPTAHGAGPIPPFGFLTLATSGQYVLIGERGTFAETGQDATLRKGRALGASSGSFALSGAGAERDMEMNGDVRLFQAVGQAAGMSFVRRVAADRGAFVLNGQESTGVKETAATDKIMPANVGRFWINLESPPMYVAPQATFIRGTIMACNAGAFAVSGQRATLDGPVWQDATPSSGSWVYVTPSGGTWTDVDPDS